MPRSQQQLRRAIPNGDDDFITLPKRLQRISPDASETQVANLDDALGGDEDVGRLEIAVEDVMRVEVEDAVEKLVEERFERWRWEREADRLRVVVNDLLWTAGGKEGRWM